MPIFLGLSLLLVLTMPAWSDDIKTQGNCSPVVSGVEAKNNVNITANCDVKVAPDHLEIMAWDGEISGETQSSFNKFLEQNGERIIKIIAWASDGIVHYSNDDKLCYIGPDLIIYDSGAQSGTEYIIDCRYHLGAYLVDGYFTYKILVKRTTVFYKFERVPNGEVFARSPKIVPYRLDAAIH